MIMININGKEWDKIRLRDIEKFLLTIEDALDLTNQSVSARKKELQRRDKSCPPDKEKEEEKELDNRDNILESTSRQRQLEVDLDSEESE